ncbi:MAG: hypothetical protein ACFB15_08190 [Cyclobacteriaceae bacterium]
MPTFSFPFILLYVVAAILGFTITIYLIFLLRTTIHYLEAKIQEIEDRQEDLR